MRDESQLTQIQWDSLVTSVQHLCQVYWGPSEAFSRQMHDGVFLQPFDTVIPLIETRAASGLEALDMLLGGFSGPAALLAYLEEGYLRLYVNDRGGITAPLYASCYENEKNPHLMGEAAVRMKKILSGLEVHISDDVREPPDHLSIQLEVLYFLLSRKRSADHPSALADAADFAAAEMLPWIQRFHRRLDDETRCRFYPLITRVLLAVLQLVSRLPETGMLHRSQ